MKIPAPTHLCQLVGMRGLNSLSGVSNPHILPAVQYCDVYSLQDTANLLLNSSYITMVTRLGVDVGKLCGGAIGVL